MSKRPLTAQEAFDLRQTLQIATLGALMASRRWEAGDLIFQGGTSLHLAYRSPRFSEDLDFLIRDVLASPALAESVNERLRATTWPAAARPFTITVTPAKIRDSGLLSFDVRASSDKIMGSVRVNVEFWKARPEALARIRATVMPLSGADPETGLVAHIPTASLEEIHADKVFAAGGRPYLKPRDVFDLHWLAQQHGITQVTEDQMRARLDLYPDTSREAWIAQAEERLARWAEFTQTVREDIRRWLPDYWPLTDEEIAAMMESASASLRQGVDILRAMDAECHTVETLR